MWKNTKQAIAWESARWLYDKFREIIFLESDL
jgi:hypothetical protein